MASERCRAMPFEVSLLGMRRDLPPSGNGDIAPKLVVFEVINLQLMNGEVPWTRLFDKQRFASGSGHAAHLVPSATRPSVEWRSVLCVGIDFDHASRIEEKFNTAWQ